MRLGPLQVIFGLLLAAVFWPMISCAQMVNTEWEQRYYFPTGRFPLDSPAKEMTRDTNGNIYVTGSIQNTNSNWLDAVVLKYDLNGVLQWSTSRGSSTNDVTGEGITTDSDGNVYALLLVGKYGLSAAQPSLLKLNSHGSVLWDVPAGGENSGGFPYHIRVDAAGNVYTAYDDGEGLTVVKFDSNGTNLWRITIPDPDGGSNYSDLKVDAAGFVYVTGMEFVTCKLDSHGTIVWQKRFTPSPGDYFKYSSDVTLDAAGNVYVTGGSADDDAGGFSRNYMATVKYNSDGKQLWVARYEGPTHQEQHGVKVVVGANGFVYVAGYSDVANIVTLKYSPSGRQLWVARYPKPSEPQSLAVDAQGNSYVEGYLFGSGLSNAVSLLKMDANGNRVWAVDYRGSSGSFNQPGGLALDTSNRVYLAATSYDLNNGMYPTTNVFIATICFQQTNPPGAPTILAQPRASTVSLGKTAVFHVNATGNGPLRYQWLFNGMPLSGHTNSTLELSDVTPDLDGGISVEVANDFGTIASPEVRLNVRLQSPSVELHLQHPIVRRTETSTFPQLTIRRTKSESDSELSILIEFSGNADPSDYQLSGPLHATQNPNVYQVLFAADQPVAEIEIRPNLNFSNDRKSERIRMKVKPSSQYSYRIGHPSTANAVILNK